GLRREGSRCVPPGVGPPGPVCPQLPRRRGGSHEALSAALPGESATRLLRGATERRDSGEAVTPPAPARKGACHDTVLAETAQAGHAGRRPSIPWPAAPPRSAASGIPRGPPDADHVLERRPDDGGPDRQNRPGGPHAGAGRVEPG